MNFFYFVKLLEECNVIYGVLILVGFEKIGGNRCDFFRNFIVGVGKKFRLVFFFLEGIRDVLI